jgi:hypothetical protein
MIILPFCPKPAKKTYLRFFRSPKQGRIPHYINDIVARSAGFYNWQTS